MRTSVGLPVTGRSGKIRIHTRPWRFIWRVIARRAASISRAVTRLGSSALRPKPPNARSVPPLATPWMRPLNCLRNFVRFGCSIVLLRNSYCCSGVLAATSAAAMAVALDRAALRGHRVVLEDLALEHPHLDAADAVGRLRLGRAVVDIGAQRVQRHPALAIPFHARDLSAAQTTRAVDADALGAEPHGRLNRALHGAAEGDAALE